MKVLKIIFIAVFIAISTFNSQAQNVLDGLYTPEHNPVRTPVPYTYLRAADVMWNKRIWRMIDVREKINHPLYYPLEPINGRSSLFDVILQGVREGSLITFNSLTDDFQVQLTREDALLQLEKPRVTQQEDPDNPGTYYEVYDTIKVSSRDIVAYEIKEDWFFDRQRSVLDVRIIGIAPIIKTYDTETGEERGQAKLFWLYFPNCRDIFAKSEVFNRANDAERRTYEDIFWKRMFGSYITKESNVYDRSVKDYALGMDALLEAERIKEDIFNLEMDLWHY